MDATILDVPKSLGHEIQRVRHLRGLSLHAAAQPAGVSAAYLQKLERDQISSPSPHRLQRLAEALEVDYGDLFRLAGYPLPDSAREPVTSTSEPSNGASVLRRMLSSEDEVTDDELDELARYLQFIREHRSPR